MDFTDTSVFDPLFWTMITAPLIPFITALIVRYSASSATKAWIAIGFSVLDAGLLVWKTADDAGHPVNWKTLAVAIVTAITVQRVTYTQIAVPNKIPEKLPKAGLVG